MISLTRLQGISSGTFLVEVENPDYMYEAVRVDINSKGKHRARKNNAVQPNQVGPGLPLGVLYPPVLGDPAALPHQGQATGKVPLLPEGDSWKLLEFLELLETTPGTS